MAAYAPVCGYELLEMLVDVHRTQQRKIFGHTMMLMAHDILQKQAKYRASIESWKKDLQITNLIVDNSLVEVLDGTTEPLKFDDVLKASEIVGADWTILPDVMGDATGTLEATSEALKTHEKPHVGKYAFVIQGNSVLEHMAIAAGLTMQLGAEMICVPRIIGNTMGSRAPTLRQIGADVKNSYKIHLLGCSQSVRDDLDCCRENIGVASIDSANPVVHGIRGLREWVRHRSRPENFFNIKPEELNPEQCDAIVSNVEEAQRDFRYVGRDS